MTENSFVKGKTLGTPRTMRLPKNSLYPNYKETHLEDDWCSKVGCTPVCEPVAPEPTFEYANKAYLAAEDAKAAPPEPNDCDIRRKKFTSGGKQNGGEMTTKGRDTTQDFEKWYALANIPRHHRHIAEKAWNAAKKFAESELTSLRDERDQLKVEIERLRNGANQ